MMPRDYGDSLTSSVYKCSPFSFENLTIEGMIPIGLTYPIRECGRSSRVPNISPCHWVEDMTVQLMLAG